MAQVRKAFWKEVRKKTWELSKEHFQWVYPVATFPVVYLVLWKIRGWDAVMDNAVPALVAGGVTFAVAVIVYGVNFIRATNIVVEVMRRAEYQEGVSFRAEVLLDTVVLHVRHRIETGFFSAQVWMMNGGVPLSTPNRSLAWTDTVEPRRVVVNGEDQTLKLMRFEVTQAPSDNHLISAQGLLYGPGGLEYSIPLTGEHIGRDFFRPHPIQLHISVTDSEERSHRVVVWISVKATKAKYPTLSSHLIREW